MNESTISLSERLRKARQLSREKHRESDRQKFGYLRAGNSGIMSESGDIAGQCHRIAHLRQLGIDIDEPEYSKLIMFERGFNNEDMIYADLKATLNPGETILREEEIPTEWSTTNGTKVSGRPDMVICKPSTEIQNGELKITGNNPILGIEIKSIASFWTAKSVLFSNEPKLPHLCQAAHYMWQMNIPWRLIYRQYSNLLIPDWGWLIKQLPKEGEPNSEYIAWNQKTGKPKQLEPFELTFSLRLQNQRLQYKKEEDPDSAWTSTLITIPDIVRYYEFTSKMASEKKLGPLPSEINCKGEKLNYNHADYCSLGDLCKNAEEMDYDVWLKAVRKLVK